MDSQMIRLKLWLKRLAVICGRVSKDRTRTMPIIRRQATMVKAMNIINMYSKSATGMRCERAYSLSKAIWIMVLRKHAKKAINKMDKPAKIKMSVNVIVSMLPTK